ncbi:dihydroorotate dehydrogenase [Pseudogemmobacter humi]|uniref:Dihydroorotate dehydrogenase n=1 Tax=Pseudogemmobacter humi TaxID=2483812 RepID=A0A3P5X9L4_9RHOB|nr:dihydroorotate dehydrogenase [Pseudogemmobacter humi]VDC31188.1 hypothetical protein XINFAN_02781 [Pseudogemmobacter humi]
METRDLDRLFARARADASEPSAALVSRVLADADAVLAGRRVPVQPRRRPGAGLRALWLSLSAGFGGGGVLASLGAVAAIAVFLGYSDPAGLGTTLGAGLGGDFLITMDATSDAGLEIVPVAEYFLSGG